MLHDFEFAGAHSSRPATAQHNSAHLHNQQPPQRPGETWRFPGFGAGALVETGFGLVPVEALRLRDPVKTRDGRFVNVAHIDKIRFDRRYLLTHPDAQPVMIKKDTFSPGVPSRPTLVSGAQRISTTGHFDGVSGRGAADYIGQGRAERALHGYFTYYVFHCGQRCTANVNGLWVDIDPAPLSGNWRLAS
jgi:hypothetical protein